MVTGGDEQQRRGFEADAIRREQAKGRGRSRAAR
jgi:hypothetical protein